MAHGELASAEQMRKIACSSARFLAEPGPAEHDEQLSKASKLLQQCELPVFEPSCEREFEDWVDRTAKNLRKPRLCVDLFRDAWITACAPRVAAQVDSLCDTAEEFIDAVAKALFPESRYHLALAREFSSPQRHENVRAAKAWFAFTLNRYLCLVRRWKHPLLLSDAWLAHTAYDCLPQTIASQTRLWVKEVAAEEIFQQAARLEASLVDASAFVMKHDVEQRALPAKESCEPPEEQVGARKCFCCDEVGHHKNDCPARLKACANCDKRGHTANVRRAITQRDRTGRVHARVRTEAVLDQTKRDFVRRASSPRRLAKRPTRQSWTSR